MTDATELAASGPPAIARVGFSDLSAALGAGFRDFRRAPMFGLFFSFFYVLGGILIFLELDVLDQSYWIIPLAAGFPLLAPFFGVGLYEVSRRLEEGAPLDWAAVLGVVVRQKDRQTPSVAAVMVIIFLFWMFLAHMIFALFMGLEPMTNILSNWQDTILTQKGLTMLAVGTAVGAIISFVLFSLTVMSLPMLLDREMDFISAMIHSFQLVLQNLVPMVAWGLFISALTLLGMAPFFLGLFVVLPVLGHATWHLYRRSMSFED
ncbi:DUF2189 domain-containing protein [Aliiroseovarius subalbicans]|uniref:DUF2189 domain-containing protein n=1 Tax=Aliiroseovarius subalbicans TaxID=2925840 RepID=UPI001F55EF9B|nr:DUF2189 domain-containing protein [Aliiroseovarius subalbicans]MCI2398500.1 DUF2189 domain-containing protein [Aliiroseovarius subalbicans]